MFEIHSVQDFITELPKLSIKSKANFFYRGQSSVDYNLEPSVFRGNAKYREDEIYLKVLTECSNEFDTNMSHIDIISKMQHYGVYTRLLDVTTNALVALYFACEGEKNSDIDGVVYLFNPSEEYVKQFDSDTISILSCLPRFNNNDKAKLLEYATMAIQRNNGRFYNEYEEEIMSFNNKDVVKRLLHEVKKEKPAFENIINPYDLLNNYFVFPKKDNPRIIRQSGAFILYGLEGENNIRVFNKIIIPSSSKKDILEQLKCFGISKATLHPELYKVAEYIADRINKEMEF